MKRVHYGGTWQQARGYSPMVATEGGRILWLSGHVGVTEESGGWGFAPDFDAQVHQSFRNIEQTLARAGGHLQDIVTMTAFIIDAGYSGRFIEIRKELFSEREFPLQCSHRCCGLRKTWPYGGDPSSRGGRAGITSLVTAGRARRLGKLHIG